jgi:hypothetical protein
MYQMKSFTIIQKHYNHYLDVSKYSEQQQQQQQQQIEHHWFKGTY